MDMTPQFHRDISFNSHHSAAGAFFSFTCGNFGTRGGFGLQSGKPGGQDLYISVKEGDRKSPSALMCLPFYEGSNLNEAERFEVEKTKHVDLQTQTVKAYGRQQIKRHFGWATDRWVTPDFELSLYTPVRSIPDPQLAEPQAMRAPLRPSVLATMRVDNTAGKSTKTMVFAINALESGFRLLDSQSPVASTNARSPLGFAFRNQWGLLAEVKRDGAGEIPEPFRILRWSPDAALRDVNAVHLLGTTPGICVEVPAGVAVTMRIALGVYLDGIVTTGLEGRYLYTRYFSSIADVLASTLADKEIETDCAKTDAELLKSSLSRDQQFILAQATRSYYGSTELLDIGGQPFWIVNEGEYCMLNTLDLAVDHVFWELKYNPWVVRNLLDNFTRFYSFVDQVRARGSSDLKPGGISFTHDMGIFNAFSPIGHSSYELPNLDAACFSHMTCEQLCNWILMATSYVTATGDLDWARQAHSTITACLESLTNRSGEEGFVALDSSRCNGGAEITTYDSLDHSLAQTRNNVYMAVKCWASYVGLAIVLERLGDSRSAQARKQAQKIESSIGQHADADGVLPAVFESDNTGFSSRILPAVEGLVYPLYWNEGIAPEETNLLKTLRQHTAALLADPKKQNLFADGGIRLSSTSNNSWLSKIALFQHVVRELFHLDKDPSISELLTKADAAHATWLTSGASAYWAMSDQFVNGVAQGSKYYPRIVTCVLWLDEH